MFLLPTTATANVENGEDIVEIVGAVLTPINCRQGAQVAIAGAAYFVAELIDTTHFRLTRDYAGATAAGVACEIGVFTPEMANRAELAVQLREYSARLQMMNSRGHGLFYRTLGPTGAADPGPGKIAYVGANWAASTALCIDVLDAGGIDSTSLIDQWALGDILLVQSIATGGYVAFALSEAATNEGPDGWRKVIEYSFIGSGGALVDDEDVRLVLWRAGTPGAGFETDEEADTQDDLAPWDDEDPGFTVFVKDMGGVDAGRAAVNRREGAAGNWAVVAWYTGPRGVQGYKGWTPQLSAATDGSRRVLRLVGYVGGAGDAPTDNIGEYLKGDGTFTATIGDALDFRGAPGPDGANGGGFKGAQVRVVITGNVNLAGGGIAAGTTHDGVALDTGDLVLCMGQIAPAENGVYPAPASGTATRHADFDAWADFPGAYFAATEGTARADTLWKCTSNKGGALDTTALTFVQFVTDTSAIEASVTALQATVASAQIDILNLYLQLADANGMLLGFNRGWADAFDGTTGVDASASTNEEYDAASDCYQPTLVTATSMTNKAFNANGLGWSGNNMRQIIAAAQLSTSGTRVRFRLRGPSSGPSVFTGMTIGHKAVSGDVWDMDATPVPVTVGGVAAFTLATSANVLSDWITFSLDETKDLVVAGHFSTTSDMRRIESLSTSDFLLYSKAGSSEITTANVSGYSLTGSGWLGVVEAIEVETGVNNMGLISNAVAAPANVGDGQMFLALEYAGSLTPGTDFDVGLSANNGSAYVNGTATLWATSGNLKFYDITGIGLSGQADDAVRARVRTLTNKYIKVTGWVPKWKDA